MLPTESAACMMIAIQDRTRLIETAPRFTARRMSRPDMTQVQTDSLLKQVAAGNSAAVDAMIDAYGGLIWSLARRYFGRSAEAEDAVQDTYIALWKSADRFDPRTASESTFVAMIARRRMIDRLRRQGRRIETQPLDTSPDPQDGSTHRLIDQEQAQVVLKVIDELDPPQPEVIRRSLMDGLTHAEIAEAMQLPLGTVKTHIRRGLMKVRKALGLENTSAPNLSGVQA